MRLPFYGDIAGILVSCRDIGEILRNVVGPSVFGNPHLATKEFIVYW